MAAGRAWRASWQRELTAPNSAPGVRPVTVLQPPGGLTASSDWLELPEQQGREILTGAAGQCPSPPRRALLPPPGMLALFPWPLVGHWPRQVASGGWDLGQEVRWVAQEKPGS